MKNRSVLWLSMLWLLPQAAAGQAALADACRQRAEALYAEAKYDQATAYYEKAYRLVRHTDPVRAANLCVDLSSMDYMKGHNRRATERCRLGQRHLRTATRPPDSVAFKLFSSLGTFYKEMYQSDSARFCFRQADELLAGNPRIEQQIPIYVLYHFNNQGSWFFNLGNYTRSVAYLTKARKIANAWDKPEDAAYVESNLAGCYEAMGDYRSSLNSRMLAHRFYIKKDIQHCRNLSGIGWILHKLHHHPEALRYLFRSDRLLTVLRRERPSADYAADHIRLWHMMSVCYRSANQLTQADRYITKALRIHRRFTGLPGSLLAKLFVERGLLYEARREPGLALQAYQTALWTVCRDTTKRIDAWRNPPVKTTSDEPMLLLAARHKAAVLKKLYNITSTGPYLDAAVATYRFSVAIQQRIRHGIDADQSQLLFTDHGHTLVPEAISVVFDAYRRRPSQPTRELLFSLFEQAQATGLREALRLNTIKPRTLPRHLLAREQRLKNQISQLRKQSVGDTTVGTRLAASEIAWHQLIDTFRHDYPAYYRLHYQNDTLTSRTLQRWLDAETAYLSYVRHGTSLYILAVTRQGVEVIRQPIDSVRFDRHLTLLRQQLYRDPVLVRYDGTASAADLYAVCIAPVRRLLTGKTRLIIARDWSFTFLPFEVLETGRQARDYLTNHYAIAYAFSAQLFFDRSRPRPTNRSVLMVAPFARPDAVELAVNRQGGIRPLASSESEARSIGGELLLGSRATLRTFLQMNLARPVVYLATHARTDDLDPANSYVAFYPNGEDKLFTEEIYNLPLSATGLVVLGACETGSGRVVQGEGVLSLARAFAYAGCPSVVTTLWQANDETTSFLTIRLHHYLTQGSDVDRALQQARRDFFRSPLFPKYDHPYYWANFTLLGNHAPVMPGRQATATGWWLFGAGLIGLVIIWQRNRLARIITN